MGVRIKQEEFAKKVEILSKGKFSLKSEYTGRYDPILLHCNIHNIDFYGKGDWFAHGEDIRGNCPKCIEEYKLAKKQNNYVELTCAYCGKKFTRLKSRLVSKSGLYFCCRECKDLAQRIESGDNFKVIRPNHYSQDIGSIYNYRKLAFSKYPKECAICHFSEDTDLLEVHHIDENRQNNNLDNLIILCPLCHKKITSQKYKLINRNTLIKI